ncbi:MAG: AAA family ATPase [Deltaproteobacteria bacterium]|jgi:general secretion pathway protein A|nr:AAA family ATPase [Deltaproteobacteria bacterium]
MYENFFSFSEKPFKLVPNPAYLFLSKSHEEALAHLNYALAQGDGFVEITGEVGTGKTTLCRSFLENLDENTIAAYIFNPRLGPKQLIKTINDELGIKYDSDNTKDLIDRLNNFLMRQKAAGKKVILLIDEAQNLSRNILEQLRLLSNLETSREKLLQIILVGQPELSDILDSHELRQLGQRITLRYHLTPLNYKETVAYIKFRINIASRKAGIKFDRSAYRQIYNYSEGIPRVINIACDRALLTAFGLSQRKISGSVTRASIRELKTRGAKRRYDVIYGNKAIGLFAALALVLIAVIFRQPLMREFGSFFSTAQRPMVEASIKAPSNRLETASLADEPKAPATAADQEETEAVAPVSGPSLEPEPEAAPPPAAPAATLKLMDYLATMEIRSSRHTALRQALELWGASVDFKPYLDSLDDDQAFFRLTAKPGGFFIHRLETNMGLLKRLNLPAILECYPPGSDEPGYLTLTRIDGAKLYLGTSEASQMIETDSAEINFTWSGIAYLPWKNFLSIWGTIPLRSSKDSIITLKLLLSELGFGNVEMNDAYDSWTKNAVEEVQAKYGIPVDGYVGPLTKIILYREKDTFEMPYLTR